MRGQNLNWYLTHDELRVRDHRTFLPSPCNLNVVFVKSEIFKFCKLPRSEADAQDKKRSSEGTRSSANNQISCEAQKLQDKAGNERASTLSYARLKPGTRVRAERKNLEKYCRRKMLHLWHMLANTTFPVPTQESFTSPRFSTSIGFCISDLS